MPLPDTEPLLLIPDVQLAGKLPPGVLSIISISIIIVIIDIVVAIVSTDMFG